MTGVTPSGPEAKVENEQFLKRVASLFANVFTGGDGSEDLNPFDILIAYRDLFNRIDSDRDGRLYPDQLHELVRGLTRMESAGVSRSPDVASTEMIVNHLDKAKKGYVSYSDFLSGALLSTDAPSSDASTVVTENHGDDEGDFVSAMGPSGATQHSSVFEDQLELDFKPSSSSSSGNSSARPSKLIAADDHRESSSLTQLRSEAHLLEQRLSAAQSELDKSELSRADLLSRLNEQDRQLEGYKKQVKVASEAEQERNRISDEMEQLRANLHTARESLKAALKVEAELKTERDQLREDLFQKGKEINDIEDKLRELRETASGAEDARSQLSSLQSQLASQTERYDSLLKEKGAQDAAHAKLVEALHELQAKHEVTLLEAEDAKRKFLELSDEKSALAVSQASSSSRSKGSNLKAELTSAMRPMSPTKFDSSTSSSSSMMMSTSLPSAPNLLSSTPTDSSPASIATSDEVVVQLRIELDMLTKEKKALLAHLSTAEAKTTLLEREKHELSARLATLTSDLTNAERTRGSLQRQHDAEAELEDLKGRLQAAQDAVTAANAAAAKAAASAFVRPEATITENELEELRVLRLSRRELEEQLAKLKAQTERDSFQTKALRDEIQTLREQNRALKARVAQIPEEPVSLNPEDDMRRGLIGNAPVARHNQGCCDSCTIL